MTIYTQATGINLMGILVKNFPNGIQAAFDSLIETLGKERDYYGVSWMDEQGNIVYYAMARQSFLGEEVGKQYEMLTLPPGDYQTETVYDWLSKTDCIKDVFHGLMKSCKSDKNNPCVEWYKSDKEMVCMVKAV